VTLRAIIADDEPLARGRLRRLLHAEHEVEVVAECRDGAESVTAIRELRPDVVFLDIEMPELDGFEVLAALESSSLPAIVFVTAYDAHAIRAFEAHALDYLLKPVDSERLHRSVERVRQQADVHDRLQKLSALVRERGAARSYIERFAVHSRGRTSFITATDVLYIEAAGNYARLQTASGHHLLRETLANLEAKLDPKQFVRIHRSAIVNVAAVRELRPWLGGDAIVVMRDGKELALSRTYRERAAAAGLR
jgi:two-component system LytT family response regulator